jgi:L-iditol 2-dehydrogenase
VTTTHRVLHLVGPEAVDLREEAIPAPASDELVLRVDAATTCGTDLKVFLAGGHPRMLRPPCPFGHEMAGTVVAAGRDVGGWRAGDVVVVANSASCGACTMCRAGRENLCRDLEYLNGAFADHVRVPARFVRRSLYRRPPGVDPAAAALAEPLACVLHGMAAVAESLPEEVLVLGGGPIGQMFTAELARRDRRVVLADPVAPRREVAARLGAADTVEVTGGPDDVDRLRTSLSDGARLVIEATGSPRAWQTAMEITGLGGTVILFGGCPQGTTVPLDTHRLHYSELTVLGIYHHRPATFAEALELLATGALDLSPLVEAEHGLDGVERALRAMQRREILKAAIRPEL